MDSNPKLATRRPPAQPRKSTELPALAWQPPTAEPIGNKTSIGRSSDPSAPDGSLEADGGLEIEPCSPRGDAAGRSARDRAQVQSADVVRDLARVKVQILEYVIGIRNSNLAPSPKHPIVRQAETLGQRQINVLVSGKIERVAPYRRGLRKGVPPAGVVFTGIGRTAGRCEIGRATGCKWIGPGERSSQSGNSRRRPRWLRTGCFPGRRAG